MNHAEQINILNDLRKKIPDGFQCKKGCHDCCGIIVWSPIEWMLLPDKFKGLKQEGLECPYYNDEGCLVYEHRPILCRLFGVVDNPMMICPHKLLPADHLTNEQSTAIMAEYIKLIEVGREKPKE